MALRMSTHRFLRTISPLAIAMAALGLVRLARAEWPNDPNSPLVLGNFQGFHGHSVATAPDGAAWVAWADSVCVGFLRLQRIAPDGTLLATDGLPVYPDPGCGNSTPPLLAACADGSALVCRAGMVGTPAQRISPDGTLMWGGGVIVDDGQAGIGGLLGLPDGDALIAWYNGWNVRVQRYATDGTPIWEQPAAIPTPTPGSKNIFGLISDGTGGAFVVWDRPGGPYVRMIEAGRVTADGQTAWGSSIVVPNNPGSSRHTAPVAMSDGAGGVVVVWTEGSDPPSALSPLYMQRVTANGALVYPIEGVRPSTEINRMYGPSIDQDPATGDILIAWWNGLPPNTSIRVQRMSLAGKRLWADTGVLVSTIQHPSNWYEARWQAGHFTIALSDPLADPEDPTVTMHRVDGSGQVADNPWPVSGSGPAGTVHSAPLGDALVVTWIADGSQLNDQVVAQRVNADGSLGLPLPADLDNNGVVDLEDHALLFACLTGPNQSSTPVTCPPDMFTAADLDNDADVDLSDHAELAATFGTTLP